MLFRSLDRDSAAAALQACDVLVQPYPDGITTRRTSVMAGLNSGIATVSTAGPLTERIWVESRAVALAPVGDVTAFADQVALLTRDAAAREALGRRGAQLYADRFSIERTVAVLRGAAAAAL